MSKEIIPSKSSCEHGTLQFSSTSHAAQVGYKRPNIQQRIAATTPSGSVKVKIEDKRAQSEANSPNTFPASLILPDDDLALDPTYPPQSLRSWIREKDRNKVTPVQRTIYLAAPPRIDLDVDFLEKWALPKQADATKIKQPDAQHVLDYLNAFYHGLPVKLISPDVFNFTPEVDDMMNGNEVRSDRQIIGLSTQTKSGCKGIRSRPTPDGIYSNQLNLDDLLDAAIWALPGDAYALLLLVQHDLYEDEEDEFVCGRAYGGSRVAVISTARYHPALDRIQGIERDHAWPASHCEKYLQACLSDIQPEKRRNKRGEATRSDNVYDDEASAASPLKAAVFAHSELPSLEKSPPSAMLSGLWLGRVCRTASHELGHCFGMDHCVYYACSMQGSASIVEDARQPPYLCPVDLAKVLRATEADSTERYEALLVFSEQHQDVHLFAGYAAWIRARLEQLRVLT